MVLQGSHFNGKDEPAAFSVAFRAWQCLLCPFNASANALRTGCNRRSVPPEPRRNPGLDHSAQAASVPLTNTFPQKLLGEISPAPKQGCSVRTRLTMPTAVHC